MRRPLNWLVVAISLCFLSVGSTLSGDGDTGASCYLESDGVYFSRPALFEPAADLDRWPAGPRANYPAQVREERDRECYLRGSERWAAHWASSASS